PVHPRERGGDVAVDDVPLLERPVVGDAVHHHLVDAGAHALLEAVVAERARIAAPGDVPVVNDGVERVRGHARPDLPTDLLEHLGRGAAGAAHPVHARRGVPADAAARSAWRDVVRTWNLRRHRAHRGDPSRLHPALARDGRPGAGVRLAVALLVLEAAPAPAGVVRTGASGKLGRVHGGPLL